MAKYPQKTLEAYQALIRILTEYVVVINREYRIVSANELFERDFSHPGNCFGDFCYWTGGESHNTLVFWSAEEHVGQLCYRCWKNRDSKCDNCHVTQVFEDGRPRTSEETVVTADGRSLRIRVVDTPVKNDEGTAIFVIQTATDIALENLLERELEEETGALENLLAEKYLQTSENEKKFRLVFEGSQVMIVLTDMQGRMEDVNPAGLKMLGYESKSEMRRLESIGSLFWHSGDWEAFRRQLEREGAVRDFETILKTREESEVPAIITANVLFDRGGRILGYQSIIRDITVRKRSEERLRQTNRELAAINAINTARSSLGLEDMIKRTLEEIWKLLEIEKVRIYLVDELGEVIYLVAARGLGEEFVEKTHSLLESVGEGLIGQAVVTGKEVVFSDPDEVLNQFREDVRNSGIKSGAYIPLLSKQNVLGVIAVTSQTSHVFTPRQVKFLTVVGEEVGIAVENALLYEQTLHAYEELKSTQEQLIQTEKLASLGKMSSIFAHEINNPIAAILTYVKLVTKILNKSDTSIEKRRPDIIRYLETAQHEATRCGEIIKNLLTFARQSSPRIEGNSIEQIIQRTLPLISHELKLKGIGLVVDIAPGLPLVKCDFRQIQQALLNIMLNGSEAMETGGTLTVAVRHSSSTGMVEIRVSDTGHGISQDHLNRIFEPFFTTKDEGKGVGLGLAVVYGIITLHKGTIEVQSTKGKGTVFLIQLPIEA
jgi:PAS domain S-box-containing protein